MIFVSHNLATIQALCQRGILLERGRVVADAPVDEAIASICAALERAASDDLLKRERPRLRAGASPRSRAAGVDDIVSGEADVVVGGRTAKIVDRGDRGAADDGVPS